MKMILLASLKRKNMFLKLKVSQDKKDPMPRSDTALNIPSKKNQNLTGKEKHLSM